MQMGRVICYFVLQQCFTLFSETNIVFFIILRKVLPPVFQKNYKHIIKWFQNCVVYIVEPCMQCSTDGKSLKTRFQPYQNTQRSSRVREIRQQYNTLGLSPLGMSIRTILFFFFTINLIVIAILVKIMHHYHASLSCIIIIHHYHASLSSIIIIHHYHSSFIIIMHHYHASNSSIIIIQYHHPSLSSIIIIHHYHPSLSFIIIIHHSSLSSLIIICHYHPSLSCIIIIHYY